MKKLEVVRVRDGKRSVHWPSVGALALIVWPPLLVTRWIYDVFVAPESASDSWIARAAWAALLALVVALAITRMLWDRHGAALAMANRRRRGPRPP